MASAATAQAEPAWLTARRERAVALSEELALPDSRTPGWEFTEISGLDLESYPAAADGQVSAAEGVPSMFGDFEPGPRIGQVDGCTLGAGGGELPEGVIVSSLADALAEHSDLLERHLGTIVSPDDPFVARNEAAWEGGAFVYVPRGVRLEAPVAISVIQDAAASSLHWRTLIVLEEGAEAEVWEQYVSSGAEVDALFNGVVELSVGPNARLRYICGQHLSERSWNFGSQRAEVDRDGSLDWVALGFGSARGKVRMETKLAGPGAEAKVTGAYAGRGRQHLDFDTTQEHAAPSTTSDLAFRGILDDRSTAVWRGMIRVDPGAQQTDAFQESRNLLLSKRAHADAIPGLEILANDVRCTHAAAIAQIDAEQLFYLRSHGLPSDIASRLVIEGFMQALVERFAAGRVHDTVAGALERRLEEVLGS